MTCRHHSQQFNLEAPWRFKGFGLGSQPFTFLLAFEGGVEKELARFPLEPVRTECVSYLPKVASTFFSFLTLAGQAYLTCLLKFQYRWRVIFPVLRIVFSDFEMEMFVVVRFI